MTGSPPPLNGVTTQKPEAQTSNSKTTSYGKHRGGYIVLFLFLFFFLLSFRYISSAVIYQCFLSGFTCALRTHSARRTDEESGSSHVSSLTMVLAVILVVKAGLLCIAIVAVLYRYIFGLACFRCCLKPRMLYN